MGEPIVACATPYGVGAIAVVRLSGAALDPLIRAVCGRVPRDRRATLVRLRDAAGPFDEGLVTVFRSPASYTGEDVAEVSCHGNPLLVTRLLDAFVAAGARIASPGEFTRRAYLAGRMDLTRAEAVADLLAATSARGLALARANLGGALGTALDGVRAGLVDVAAELEAILDYPGEDLLFAGDGALVADLAARVGELERLLATAEPGRVAVEGARVALVGPVNAGKSTLLNALAGRTRALVSPLPGTTRDVVEVTIRLPDLAITLVDTAGERETADPIERAGLELGREAAREADLRLLVLPLHVSWEPRWTALAGAGPTLTVGTHADLAGPDHPVVDVAVAAPEGRGIPELVEAVRARLGGSRDAPEGAPEGPHLTTRRQAALLADVLGPLRRAVVALPEAGPAAAVEELYAAVGAIDVLTGRDTRESVLDRLFARFCVGK